VSLPKFIALAFEKAHPPSQTYLEHPSHPICSFCELRIDDKIKGL
jgi:hypothetical protein